MSGLPSARPRLRAAVFALVAFVLLAAPAAGQAAAGLKLSAPYPAPTIFATFGSKRVLTEYTITNFGSSPQNVFVSPPVQGTNSYLEPSDIYIDWPLSTCGVEVTKTLQPGESCSAMITFLPPSDAVFGDAQWQVSLGGEIQTVDLRSDGLAPRLTWGTREVNFGDLAPDTEVTRTETLTNESAQEVKVDKLKVEGDTQTYELISDDCAGRWIPRKGTCSATVRYRPRGTGAFHGAVVAFAPGLNGPDGYNFRMELVGRGNHPKIEASRSSLTFGATALGRHGAASHELTVKNVGLVATHVLAAFSGGAAHDFRITDDGCAAKLEPGASCRLEVAFVPSALGLRRAQLHLLGDGGARLAVALEGTGAE
jgi:hypothetical protein